MQELWNFKGGQLVFNSHKEQYPRKWALQQSPIFHRGVGETLDCPAKVSPFVLKTTENVKMFDIFSTSTWVLGQKAEMPIVWDPASCWEAGRSVAPTGSLLRAGKQACQVAEHHFLAGWHNSDNKKGYGDHTLLLPPFWLLQAPVNKQNQLVSSFQSTPHIRLWNNFLCRGQDWTPERLSAFPRAGGQQQSGLWGVMTKIGHAAKQLQVRKGIWAMGCSDPRVAGRTLTMVGVRKRTLFLKGAGAWMFINMEPSPDSFTTWLRPGLSWTSGNCSEGIRKERWRLMSLW